MNIFSGDITLLAAHQLHLAVTECWLNQGNQGVVGKLLIGSISLLRPVTIERRVVCAYCVVFATVNCDRCSGIRTACDQPGRDQHDAVRQRTQCSHREDAIAYPIPHPELTYKSRSGKNCLYCHPAGQWKQNTDHYRPANIQRLLDLLHRNVQWSRVCPTRHKR